MLNARFHEQEAEIVAAGRRAGRGDDRHQHGRPRHRHQARRQSRDAAQEGTRGHRRPADCAPRARRRSATRSPRAHEQVKQAGGLFVIGTERHESRRIDNQLRGRSGRQGDPGRSRFFLSLEDDLMRIFGSDRMGGMLQKLGLKQGEAIVHPVDQQGAGESAEEGRGAQLRHPQERAEIRRRDERPAQGGLRPAQGVHAARRTSPKRWRKCAPR